MAKLSPYAGVSATREVLQAHGYTTKKSLGQHFLVDDGIISKTLDLAEVNSSDVILEIGPGIGTLTAALLDRADWVIAIERDRELYPILADTLASWQDRFVLVGKDALDFTYDDLQGLRPNKLVANLPYAVAATVVLDYLRRFDFLESATVMVQKEVAARMMAQPNSKNYGAYTVKLSLFAEPGGHFPVSPRCFFPPPHVDSTVIRLNRIMPVDDDGVALTHACLETACIMADAAFANRRKTILNSCRTYFAERGQVGARVIENLSSIFDAAQIKPDCRAEMLTRFDFIKLAKAYCDVLG